MLTSIAKEIMKFGYVFWLFVLVISMQRLTAGDIVSLGNEQNNYTLSVGERDKDRLLIQDRLCQTGTERFLRSCGIPVGARVLEIGCGLGQCAQVLARIVGETGSVLATDISTKQLDLAQLLADKSLRNIEFKNLSVFDLDKTSEKFDVIYMRFVLLHMPDQAAMLTVVKNALKPGGKLIIEDITGNYTLRGTPDTVGLSYVKLFDQKQFEMQNCNDCYFDELPFMVVQQGFKVELLERYHPRLTTVQDRSLFTYGCASLHDALIGAKKMTEQEYQHMYKVIDDLVHDPKVDLWYYEMGSICCTI